MYVPTGIGWTAPSFVEQYLDAMIGLTGLPFIAAILQGSQAIPSNVLPITTVGEPVTILPLTTLSRTRAAGLPDISTPLK